MKSINIAFLDNARKVSKFGVFPGLDLPVFSTNPGNEDEKNSKFGHFLGSVRY